MAGEAPTRHLYRPLEAYELDPEAAWHSIGVHGSLVCYRADVARQLGTSHAGLRSEPDVSCGEIRLSGLEQAYFVPVGPSNGVRLPGWALLFCHVFCWGLS
jgi:hypothetical protein